MIGSVHQKVGPLTPTPPRARIEKIAHRRGQDVEKSGPFPRMFGELILAHKTVIARRVIQDDSGKPLVEMVGWLVRGQESILALEQLRILCTPALAQVTGREG